MRVLHVVASLAPRYGGPSASTPEMVRALRQEGVDAAIYATNVDGPGLMDVPLYRTTVQAGLPTVYAGVYPPNRFAFSPGLGYDLRRRVRDYDLLHIHGVYSYPALLAAHSARRCGVPYIVRPHGSLDPYLTQRHRYPKLLYHKVLLRPMLTSAAALHFTTEDERRSTTWLNLRTPSFVLPHGLDLKQFADMPPVGSFRRAWPQCAGKRIVLFLSRVDYKKGLDLLIKGFRLLDPARHNAHLVIAGPDSLGFERQVRRWVIEEGLESDVTFTGMLMGKEKLAALGDSDLFVLPSYSENFGLAVVEAMACYKPVIISDRVNLCEDVHRGQAGIVVNCAPDAVAAGIRQVLEDPMEAARLGHNGHELVRRRYSWKHIAASLCVVYRQILERWPVRGRA
jgi:glycosyltransferase involved in cell wall biosynthesis